MPGWEELLFGYLFIFFARVIDMSLDVIRLLFLMRNRRLLSTVIGFIEISIFIVALNKAISGGLTDPGKIVAYAGGFATGNYIGSLIEEKLAFGHLSMQIFPAPDVVDRLVATLKQAGFGVTAVAGEGRYGKRDILFVAIKRKDLQRAVDLLRCVEPDTFFNISETRNIHGGIFPERKGK
jgi:uncharacterized protein YebE (UPF0316 family)